MLSADMIGIDQPIRPPDAGRPHIAFSQPGDTDRAEPIAIRCALHLIARIGTQLQAARIAGIDADAMVVAGPGSREPDSCFFHAFWSREGAVPAGR